MNELLEPLRHALQTMPYDLQILLTLAAASLWLFLCKLLRDRERARLEAAYERIVGELSDEGGCAPITEEQREHLKTMMP